MFPAVVLLFTLWEFENYISALATCLCAIVCRWGVSLSAVTDHKQSPGNLVNGELKSKKMSQTGCTSQIKNGVIEKSIAERCSVAERMRRLRRKS